MMTGSSSGWLMLAGMMARPAGDLGAHEFGRDELRDFGAEILAVGAAFGGARDGVGAAEVLAVRDVDHLLGDDPGAGEFELRDRLAGAARAARCEAAGQAGTSLSAGDIAVVLGLDRARRRCGAKPRLASHGARTGGSPASRSIVAAGSVYGPEVS